MARDLFERSMTFTEYVAFYGLARAEGLVLRYLADAYKALRQTVPETKRTEGLEDLIAWLGELVRQTDSSLLDEWEKLAQPDRTPRPSWPPRRTAPAGCHQQRAGLHGAGPQRAVPSGRAGRPPPLVGAGRAGRRPGVGRAGVGGGPGAYFAEHGQVQAGANARGPALLIIDRRAATWQVRQILDDPEGDHDYSITAEVDLAASDEAGEAILTITGAGRTAAW